MIRKSLLLNPITALAVVFFAITSWAAGISEEQEGASRFFCVRLAQNLEYGYVIQLSQQDVSYEPTQNESCFEKWYSPDEYQTAYAHIGDLLRDTDKQPGALVLTSDIEFAGYNEQARSCNEEFKSLDYNVNDPIDFMSAEGGIYTISGICYTSLSDEASFGGSLIGSIKNVKFENIRLESLTFASLFGQAVGYPRVNNVYVSNAVISAPTAGLFVSSTESLQVSDFEGNSITVRSIPDMDLSNAVDLIYPSSVEIGGLAGRVSNMYAAGVSINGGVVSNNVYVEGAPYFVERTAQVEAHLGGIVGHTEKVEMYRVGLEKSLMSDGAAGEGIYSYMGGLVGSFTYSGMVWFQSTYSYSDISCSVNKDPTYCKAGYIAGLAEFPDRLSENSNDISLVSNYHYTIADYDSASGIFGEAYCDYLKDFMPSNELDEDHISCADDFNTFGELSVLDDVENLVSKTYAHGNYRSATESTPASQNFDPDTYMIGGDTRNAVSVGVIEQEYMFGRAFADVLNNFNSEYGNAPVEWIADNSGERPHIESTFDATPTESHNVQVTFVLDCIEDSDCLTSQERYALESFYDFSDGSYTITFDVDRSGRIANEAWLQFAYSLTEPNPDRDDVYWDQSLYQPFSIDNIYDYSVTYTLVKAGDTRDVKVYAFFGNGIDYDRTIVELISYDGEDVEEKGNEIDRANYSGGDQPVVMNVGNIMQVVARNPVTTDGSAFKGWTVLAELVQKTDNEELRKKAFAGYPVYLYSDGSFSFDDIGDILRERFKPPVDSQYQAWYAELEKNTRELQAYVMSGDVDEDSLSRIEARGDSISQLMNEWTEKQESTMYNDMVIVLAIYPKGFEDQNGTDPYPLEPQRDTILAEVEYPALFQSGNGIQLAVKTDEFVYEEIAPFVSVRLEDLGGEPLQDTLFEFTDGEWPETFTWEKYPLAPGRYLLTAKIYDGKNQNPDVRQWDFEVKTQIADECSDCWYMVSLSNVVLDKVNPSDENVLYWWNEQSVNGKYWQYEEVARVSDVDRTRGYWYNSIEGLPLELDEKPLDDDFVVWEVDSVFSGWNMVRNPFGWYIDVSDLKSKGYAFYRWDPEQGNYVQPHYIKPYEAFWIKTKRYEVIDLPSTPAFVDVVDADGNTVPYRALQKKQVLAKATGSED